MRFSDLRGPCFDTICGMSKINDCLRDLGLALPEAPKPVASYIPVVESRGLLFVSGQVPFRNGSLMATGPVPSVCSVETAEVAAAQCVVNGLAAVNAHLNGDLDRISRVVRVGVFVASDPSFTKQPSVANGASELLVALFGENGKHARAAVGSVALPLGASVEVEMVLELTA